jgi:hypothetical protein
LSAAGSALTQPLAMNKKGQKYDEAEAPHIVKKREMQDGIAFYHFPNPKVLRFSQFFHSPGDYFFSA